MPTTINSSSCKKAAPGEFETVVPFVPGETEAKDLNDDHQSLQDDFADLTDRQVRIGEKLEKIKKAVGRGHFQQWVAKHLIFCGRTARRYMAQAKAKRTELSVSIARAISGDGRSLLGSVPEKTPIRRPALKLFSGAAVKVLNQPIEDISAEDKITILRDYERLEPIAMKLVDQPSVFSLTWQKKLNEPPVRWARRDMALLKAEIQKAQGVLASLEEDAEFDGSPNASTAELLEVAPDNEGDAP